MVQRSSFKSSFRLVLLVLIVIRGVQTGRNNTPSLRFTLSPLSPYLWFTLLDRSHSDLQARGRHTFWLACTWHSIQWQHKYRAAKLFPWKVIKMWLSQVRVPQKHAKKTTQRGRHVPRLKVSVTFHFHKTAAHEESEDEDTHDTHGVHKTEGRFSLFKLFFFAWVNRHRGVNNKCNLTKLYPHLVVQCRKSKRGFTGLTFQPHPSWCLFLSTYCFDCWQNK